MSLLEDILHVLRMVLEYFGAPPEMLVPVWDCELCGQYRSIVRMIGTNLPLQPPPRVHFQIPLISHKPQGYVDVSMDTPTIPSFADILWVCEDEGNSSTRTRCVSPGGTPVRKRRSKGGIALHSDPAALIADALKRKFAHHHHNNSSDKENSRELSPFSSPETPKFIHHRRSQGRRYI
uniref:Mitochondrial fission regulator n=1 Tax=Periophthalmus magnuspinnatus TaxID=409849 RepID=A0A3B4AZG5_9GOBI